MPFCSNTGDVHRMLRKSQENFVIGNAHKNLENGNTQARNIFYNNM